MMVRTAGEYLEASSAYKAFGSFSDRTGSFVRGDLEIFVLDTSGLCYAWGGEHKLIWENLLHKKDESGRQFIKEMIDGIKHGPVTVTAKENHAEKLYYAEKVVKDGKTYIVGSGFYP